MKSAISAVLVVFVVVFMDVVKNRHLLRVQLCIVEINIFLPRASCLVHSLFFFRHGHLDYQSRRFIAQRKAALYIASNKSSYGPASKIDQCAFKTNVLI